MTKTAKIAYFSMEIGLETEIPTYAGGLGVLAGDTVRSAADLGVPMVAVSLLSSHGYFHQRLDPTGWQSEEPVNWVIENYLKELPQRITVDIGGRAVQVRAWRYQVKGLDTHLVPVYLLDTDLPENERYERTLTHYLYGGDPYYRLCQEAILGIGGIRMLRALGYTAVDRYHMNEGHAGLLVIELMAEQAQSRGHAHPAMEDVEAVKAACVFTTHTPVPAGQDKFPLPMVEQVLGTSGPFCDLQQQFCLDNQLNMTYLALSHSHYINGVAKRHREISQEMFSGYQIDSITNGIHVATWASAPMQAIYDHYIPGWRTDNASLRYAITVPKEAIWQAHQENKGRLLQEVDRISGVEFSPEIVTLGFARRATSYKRGDLLFWDTGRLERIAEATGPLQIIFAGKAHPHDHSGKEMIQRIFREGERLRNAVRVVYLPNYDMALAKLIIAGVDIWLNTPLPPLEASGTSGMKAAVNGVPSLSVLDGWWIEGCIEGVTGWAIKPSDTDLQPGQQRSTADAAALYNKLEQAVLPLYHRDRGAFIEMMRHAIAINGSFFNTERMLNQYIAKAYFL